MRNKVCRLMMVATAISAIILLAIRSTTAEEFDAQERTVRPSNSLKSVPALLNYQGYLATSDSGAVNETLAMTFRIYDAETGGTALWSETHSAVEVSNGQFYVLLGSVTPFPGGLFDGSTLWLQTEVGSEVFSPRKPIVSVAYSQMADEADHAATADYATEAGRSARADTADYSPGTNPWSVSGDDVYRETGNVGIGTASPSAELEVIGTVDADGLTINGTPVGTSTDSYWNLNQSDIAFPSGNVGVGVSSPSAKFQVMGGKGHEVQICSENYALYALHSGGNEAHLGAVDMGAYGYNTNTGNYGVLGGEGGRNCGVYGMAFSAEGYGVYGGHDQGGNWGYLGGQSGAYGENANGNYGALGTNGHGVYGSVSLSLKKDLAYGVYGHGDGTMGFLGGPQEGTYGSNDNGNEGYLGGQSGAYGENANGNFGVLGTDGHGVYGSGADGEFSFGVYGTVGNLMGYLGGPDGAVYGQHGTIGNKGSLGNDSHGVYGYSTTDAAVYGKYINGNFGTLGSANVGAYGENSNGNLGTLGTNTVGVYGENSNGNFGTLGSANVGAYGENNNGNLGTLGTSTVGAYGENSNGNFGTIGSSLYGIYGYNASCGDYGYIGGGDIGVAGVSGEGYGVIGEGELCGVRGDGYYGVYGQGEAYGIYGVSPDRAGYFSGNVDMNGNLQIFGGLTKGGGSFKIDHPLDPENKYLYHSFVESPDMKNVYDGVVLLDAGGRAWVELPQWFGAVNRDYCYQLTPIGTPGPDLYVAEEISANRFQIAGGEPGMKVSWQVTGIRQDPYANTYRIAVEEDKTPEEQGYYLYPEVYGLSEEKGMSWLHHPDRLLSMKESMTPSPEEVGRAPDLARDTSRAKTQNGLVESMKPTPAAGTSDLELISKQHSSNSQEVRQKK